MPTKQVLVVRKDLKMRMGKVGAQCAHASMKVLLELMTRKRVISQKIEQELTLSFEEGSALELWLNDLFTKICVYVNSEEELDAIYQKAKDAGVPAALIIDSGLTEFKGQPTKTVVAIGPDFVENIDPITKGLPLL